MPIKFFSVAHMKPLKIVGIFHNFSILQDPALNVGSVIDLKNCFFRLVSWRVREIKKETPGAAYANVLVLAFL